MFPLIFSNVIHMVLVKRGSLALLDIPIAQNVFGPNKTWRGVILVIVLNTFFQYLINLFMSYQLANAALLTGALLGLTYVLCELPNSWVKRRLGIKAGEKAEIKPWIFILMDKMDSALGVSIVSTLIFNLTTNQGVIFFIIAVFVHIFFSMLLVSLGIKSRF